MFKILILQRYYNLSDGETEYQILDRHSFCRFLALSLDNKVPDVKTIWDFRERLTSAGLEKELFEAFNQLLTSYGLIAHQGQLTDASFVEVPANATPAAKKKLLKPVNPLLNGKPSLIRNDRKILTRAGPIKMGTPIMDIRTM